MSFAYLALYTGDYLRDTRHLTPLKHGVYLLLLMHCWDSRGPVPLDEQECAGVANCRSADEIDALRYVLNKYFVRMNDGWYNARMQKEIEKAQAISAARSNAGFKGYEARAKQLPSKSQAIASTPPPPLTSPPPPLEKLHRTPSVLDVGFEQFWDAYPRKVGKGTAEKAWAKVKPDAQLLAQILAAVATAKHSQDWRKDGGQFIPHPTTWLNGKRWLDAPIEKPK